MVVLLITALVCTLVNNTLCMEHELTSRDRILHEIYDNNHRHDLFVDIESRITGLGNKPPFNNTSLPDKPDEMAIKPKQTIKERSKKYALYGTIAASILTTTTTLIIHFTQPCSCDS